MTTPLTLTIQQQRLEVTIRAPYIGLSTSGPKGKDGTTTVVDGIPLIEPGVWGNFPALYPNPGSDPENFVLVDSGANATSFDPAGAASQAAEDAIRYTDNQLSGYQPAGNYATVAQLSGKANIDQTNPQTLVGTWTFPNASVTNTLKFGNSPTLPGTLGLGELFWNQSKGCLSYGLENGSNEIGQEIFLNCVNLEENPMVDGDIVSVSAISGNRLGVKLTDATNSTSARACIGMVTNGAIKNGIVRVTTFGLVHNLNTQGLTEGVACYVDPAHPGKIIQTMPQAPNYTIALGVVMVSHQNQGVFACRVLWIPSFTDLSDVDGTPLTLSGQIPIWDNSRKVFDFTSNINNYLKTDQTSAQTTIGNFSFPTVTTASVGALSGTGILKLGSNAISQYGVVVGGYGSWTDYDASTKSAKLQVIAPSGDAVLLTGEDRAQPASVQHSRYASLHYDNTQRDIHWGSMVSSSSGNNLYLGGFTTTGGFNYATDIRFMTAANGTAQAATVRGGIDSIGRWSIGFTPGTATAQLHLAGQSDQVQMKIQSYATQTNDVFEAGNITGGSYFKIHGDGSTDITITSADATYNLVNASNSATALVANAATGANETYDASHLYMATKFTAPSTGTYGSFGLRVKRTGTITNGAQVIQSKIYSDNAGQPGTVLAGSGTQSQRYQNLATSYSEQQFDISVTLTAGTSYWLVLYVVNVPTGANVTVDSAATGTNTYAYSADGTTWTLENKTLWHKVYAKIGSGVYGNSQNSSGVYGNSTTGFGGYFESYSAPAIYAKSTNNNAIYAIAVNTAGIFGQSTTQPGIYGLSTSSAGVLGVSSTASGVNGQSTSSYGVYGLSTSGYGVYGRTVSNNGIRAEQNGTLTASTANHTAVIQRILDLGVYNATGNLIHIVDNPTNGGTVGGALISGTITTTERLRFDPRVVDGASAVAHFMDTSSTLSTVGSKLLSIRNNGMEKAFIDYGGRLQLGAGTTDRASLNIPVGTLATAAVSGNIENDGTWFYGTTSTPTRKKFAFTDDSNIVTRHARFNIPLPNSYYTNVGANFCIIPKLDKAITVTGIDVTIDSASYNINGDLKYADTFIGLANATLINAIDTTSGVLSTTTISSASVAAGKCVYLSLDATPDTNIKQVSVDITYTVAAN